MEQNDTKFFDLSALLMQGDLDTRRFAETNPSISAEEYFGRLNAFLVLTPKVSRALIRFEQIDGDIEARRSLNNMVGLLEAIGCEKFVVDFHSILESYEGKGNWRLAATFARKIMEDYEDFSSRILEARNKEEAAADKAISLKEAIRILDEEEASYKPMILAVDDSPVILQSVWAILNNEYKVLTLPNPAEIENVLRKQKPDLFLLDYLMPELSGFELIPIIRSFNEHQNTPIIFLTSDGTVDHVTAALAMGARDYIVKPFKPDILREKVGKHIAKNTVGKQTRGIV